MTTKACTKCGVEKPLNVDDDHASGAIRGILCSLCNSGLGFFRDNTEALTAAIAYLQANQAVT